MSGGFYFLNEFDANKEEEKKISKEAYAKSDITYSGSYSIYIKAVQHIMTKIENIIDLIDQLQDHTNSDKIQLRNKLALDTDNVKKILAEFIKALSSAPDVDSKDTIEKMHHDFMVLDTMVDLLFVMKDQKYGHEALKVAQVLLQVLSHLADQVKNSGAE